MSKVANLQINLYGLKHILTDMSTDVAAANYTGVVGNCTVGLFTAWPGFSPDLAITDLTEADFTGYVQQAVTWSTPYESSDEDAAMTSGDHVFRPTDAVTPNIVIGAFLLDDDSNLVAAGTFDDVIPLEDADDQASILLTLDLSTTIDYGSAVAVD